SCIVEEVLRIYGYDNIPVVSLPNRQAVAGNILTLTQKRVNYIKRALCARGLFEAYSWSFCDSEKAKHFWCESAKPQNLYLQNPISEKLNIMRPTPLVTLLEAMGENHARKIFDMKLFEIGPAFDDAFDGQRLMASLLRSGANNSKDWQHNHVASNLFDIKTDMMAVIEAIGFDAQKFKITNDAPDYYHPGQSGSVMLGKNIIAHFGTLHPLVARDFTLKKTVSMGEIFIDNLPIPKSSKGKAKIKLQASAYQPVMRDFAFVLDENISAGELIASIKKAEPKYLSDVGIFDLYQDDSLGQGKKSLAVNVVLQPLQESFTDELLEEISVNIIDAAQKIGAKLRE
ncbi:MAG: phenylalanine--tRNA ligase subunit beta, partial [Alphaproteobacteria bacterium]|nr:phenylalanine--tRNA ligase subunit beta [Alphaproteobacteria bacterium]